MLEDELCHLKINDHSLPAQKSCVYEYQISHIIYRSPQVYALSDSS